MRRARRVGPSLRGRIVSRRGVASILAMMFLVLFSSLAVAMAIASKGNLRTAFTHLHVERARNAAETGMQMAEQRLRIASERFAITKGEISDDMFYRLWLGTLLSEDGDLEVLPDIYGSEDAPAGVGVALRSLFGWEDNTIAAPGYPFAAEIVEAPPDADLDVFRADGWVRTPVIALDGDAEDEDARPAAFQIVFAPLAEEPGVRVIVTGFSSLGMFGSDYHYSGLDEIDGGGRPLSRVLQRDFILTKSHEHAVLSPSRIMIGKNVIVNGDLGATFDDLSFNNGHPVVMRSDFRGLGEVLDNKLDALQTAILNSDVDGDNRLRANHAVEGAGIPEPQDYDGDGEVEDAAADVTGDGFVDEFDIFINHYDTNDDGKIVLSAALTEGTAYEGQTPEFDVDDDLALLIDSLTPDRNRNGVSGYDDENGNGRWDDGEEMYDVDPYYGGFADQRLGFRDGVIDKRDAYAKLSGTLSFRVQASEWEGEHGDFREVLSGPIDPERGEPPMRFNLDEREMPQVDADSFADSNASMKSLADGASFAEQVAAQLGVSEGELTSYVETSEDPDAPKYFRADLDPDYVRLMTGRYQFEKMPFNSPAHADWYFRPVYHNMVFRNVKIPRGTNALFVDCTFVGATYVEAYDGNDHVNWSNYGAMEWDDDAGKPVFKTAPLDKSDFLRYTTGNPADGPENYDDFPEPPVIDGETKTGSDRNTKLYSNNIRFHDCLFVGSVVGDVPQAYTHVRNKLQFTGGTRFGLEHPSEPNNADLNPDNGDVEELRKSSLLMPNYSVDVGSFNSPTDTFEGGPPGQNVNLSGTIVAGVLDVRGNTTIDGSLVLTFDPVLGEGPLQDPQGNPVGNPAGFNATLGYFGPEDGDGEALNPEDLPIVDGQRIVGWDLDGDGLADLGPDDNPSQEQLDGGATAVPFYGYGRVILNWNPDIPMPDGIMLPVRLTAVAGTYREGK